MANSQAATIDAIAGCCARIEEVCAGLDDAGWHRPTALPAWDIQDVVAHLGSLEAMFLGRDEPPHQPAAVDHVRNPLGALNERMVDRRRSWSGAEVLDEFREVTALRLDELRALDEDGLARQVPSPQAERCRRATSWASGSGTTSFTTWISAKPWAWSLRSTPRRGGACSMRCSRSCPAPSPRAAPRGHRGRS